MKDALISLLWFASAAVLTLAGMTVLCACGAFPGLTILFYRALVCCSVSVLGTFGLLLLACRKWPRWHIRDVVAATMVAASLSICFIVVLPVTIDRSISVFILSRMDSDPRQVFTAGQIRNIFVNQYVDGYQQILRRLEEQRTSGNIIKIGSGYRIDGQGIAFMKFARFLSKIFKTDPRFIQAPKAETDLPSGHHEALTLKTGVR